MSKRALNSKKKNVCFLFFVFCVTNALRMYNKKIKIARVV